MIHGWISIVIPAYNAAQTIGSVVQRIPAELWPNIKTVWVVNDGSVDETKQTVLRLTAQNTKICLIDFKKNKGYGAAVKAGLSRCKEESSAVTVCLHSDGQYPPEAIPAFSESVTNKLFDILQGSRVASGTALTGGMPVYKYVANRALTALGNCVFGCRMTDYYSGFMVYSLNALQRIDFERLSSSFDFDLEVIACARKAGLHIGELPIPTRYAGEVSYLNPVTYGIRVLGVMAKYLLGGYSPNIPQQKH